MSGVGRIHFTMGDGWLDRHEKGRLIKGSREDRMKLASNSRLIIIQARGSKVAVTTEGFLNNPADCWHHSLDVTVIKDQNDIVYLGEDGGTDSHRRNYFAASDKNVAESFLSCITWVAVKGPLLTSLTLPQQAVLGLALSLVQWHSSHLFCPRCGKVASGAHDGGYSRVCMGCHRQYFPQITPAILVAVLDGNGRVILSQRHKSSDVVTILSGFVLQGETAEEALRREVVEETGVRVESINYVGSQTWPFPNLLMLCYYAVVKESDRQKELMVDTDELVKAEWVSKEEVRQALAGTHSSIACPQSWTAANRMLRLWVNGVVNDRGEMVGDPQAHL